MQYYTDPKSGNKLSILGFGCMRFPRKFIEIDMVKTEKLILEAIRNGINYFDTAYNYPGCEEALGKILQKNALRDKVFIATKLPLRKCQTQKDFDKLFETQLKRLRTDYIDYYFMHNLSNISTWQRLCELGIEKWIKDKKAEGKIKQTGFSFHGPQSEFAPLLNAYNWDFCQIQYNYVNINYQAGVKGLHEAFAKGTPVFIMEPLLGGKLGALLPPAAAMLFKNVNKPLAPAAWALCWLWNQKEVAVVVSGMKEDWQIRENVKIAADAAPNMLTEEENNIFEPVTKAFRASYKIPCTECNYCLPCPENINIPGCFEAYNLSYTAGLFSGLQQYLIGTGATNPDKNYGAGKCKKCGQCIEHCPQQIEIIKWLQEVEKRLEPFWVKGAITVFNKFVK
jgi:predicted aldo/keto reductase-like oxidoreductase